MCSSNIRPSSKSSASATLLLAALCCALPVQPALAQAAEQTPAPVAGSSTTPTRSHAERTTLTSRLLLNESFTEWEDSLPKDWSVSVPAAATRTVETETGAPLLSVYPGEADYVDVRQTPDPALLLPGDHVIFEVDCYADEAATVEAVLRINHGSDKRIIMRESHPGGGWAKLRTLCQVPAEQLTLVECRIRVLKNAPTPIRVRHATAQVVPAIP